MSYSRFSLISLSELEIRFSIHTGADAIRMLLEPSVSGKADPPMQLPEQHDADGDEGAHPDSEESHDDCLFYFHGWLERRRRED